LEHILSSTETIGDLCVENPHKHGIPPRRSIIRVRLDAGLRSAELRPGKRFGSRFDGRPSRKHQKKKTKQKTKKNNNKKKQKKTKKQNPKTPKNGEGVIQPF